MWTDEALENLWNIEQYIGSNSPENAKSFNEGFARNLLSWKHSGFKTYTCLMPSIFLWS